MVSTSLENTRGTVVWRERTSAAQTVWQSTEEVKVEGTAAAVGPFRYFLARWRLSKDQVVWRQTPEGLEEGKLPATARHTTARRATTLPATARRAAARHATARRATALPATAPPQHVQENTEESAGTDSTSKLEAGAVVSSARGGDHEVQISFHQIPMAQDPDFADHVVLGNPDPAPWEFDGLRSGPRGPLHEHC